MYIIKVLSNVKSSLKKANKYPEETQNPYIVTCKSSSLRDIHINVTYAGMEGIGTGCRQQNPQAWHLVGKGHTACKRPQGHAGNGELVTQG